MKCALIIVALLVCVQLAVGQTTTATVAEFTNSNCTITPSPAPESVPNVPNGVCSPVTASTSILVVCSAGNVAAGSAVSYFTNSASCSLNTTYWAGVTPANGCAPLTLSGAGGSTNNYVTVTCTTTGAAATTAVSGLLLAVLAFFAMQKL